MKENPLRKLHALGQSVWLDYIRRDLISSGERGQVAIASAKSAHQIYGQIFGGERFRSLANKNARAQRPLWASTGTKKLNYGDIKHVEALIGADTGISIDNLAQHLEDEGVVKLTTPFDRLLATLLKMARSNRRAVIS